MKETSKFSLEVRKRAGRMVQEHRGEYPSVGVAVESMAPKIGGVPQTLLRWVKREESDEVWKQMNRENIPVARCTVEHLMRRRGCRARAVARRVRPTVPDRSAPCPLDLVNRQFNADSRSGSDCRPT